ncbi:MAG: hypothetical protein LBE47_00770 [Methanomassiliicoccaceae archaeon]|jgi:hypothetical protein|nr:hypothetical protein [Methanomassiliicoccaceae archaeon]
MSTEAEGRFMREVFMKYYEGMEIQEYDRETLDRLVAASHIVYALMEDGRVYAQASPVARGLKDLSL